MSIVLNGTSGITTPGIDASGTNKFATTIGVGNATPAASGAGITFPATASASSDANTLDDYEEGSWTPTITGSSTAGTGTYQQQVGRYTKIGNLVTVVGHLEWSAHTGTGNMRISNLPFTILSLSDYYGSATFGYVANVTLTANSVMIGLGNNSGTLIGLYSYPVGGGSISAVSMDTAAQIIFSMSYQV